MNELTQEDIDALNRLIKTGLDFRIDHAGGGYWTVKLWLGPLDSCAVAHVLNSSLAKAINAALVVNEG